MAWYLSYFCQETNNKPEKKGLISLETLEIQFIEYFFIIFKVNHQLGTNRNARHQLERDLANKDNAISIGKFWK